MTKRQGLLLALVLASGSTLLTYLWYSGKNASGAGAKKAATQQEEQKAVAIQPAAARVTAAGYQVPRYQRLVVIEVDASRGAGALARATDHVDILLAAKDTQAPHLTETILQDVLVMGPQAEQPQQQQGQGQGGQAPAPAPAPAPASGGKRQLVVAVSPHDAQRLVAAQIKGDLVVTLRNPGDREFAFVTPIAGSPRGPVQLTTAPVMKAPARAAAASQPVRHIARRSYARRPLSMASLGISPEPIPSLPLLPAAGTPEPRSSNLAPIPEQKTIEVVKGTAVQTVTVKE